MPFNRLSTTKIARAVGCHPNTVRLYEQIGFIAPVPRSPKGYRLYTEHHLDQMRLARAAMQGEWPGRVIRRSSMDLIRASATYDYPAALDLAHAHRSVIRLEREQAETAVVFLESWVSGQVFDPLDTPLRIGQVAALLHVTVDVLRNWERSGLVSVPRDPLNRYRLYHAAQIGRVRVIRMLRQAGYSPMAILRMLLQLDRGHTGDLRRALDTPRPDEDVYVAADRWLSTLADHEQRAEQVIALAEAIAVKYNRGEIQPQ